MKVYTKTGDKETTALIGGSRVSKASTRIDCYGTTDEALAQIGLVFYYLEEEVLINQVKDVMRLFFYIGQDLANPDQSIPYATTSDDVLRIEGYIDFIDERNDKLTTFILPAGYPASCHANIARTIVRRAERLVVNLNKSEEINPVLLPLMNRLSDYLYVLSRYLNKINNYQELMMNF